jgi:hypothetical protein
MELARDAEKLARQGYVPVSQSYAPGRWGCLAFLIALALCVILIGILVFVYMLIVEPDGTLTVTYHLQPQTPAPSVDAPQPALVQAEDKGPTVAADKTRSTRETESQQWTPMKRHCVTAAASLVAGLLLGIEVRFVASRLLPPSREQVANYLSNLSLSELADFTKRLTAQWGFQPDIQAKSIAATPPAPQASLLQAGTGAPVAVSDRLQFGKPTVKKNSLGITQLNVMAKNVSSQHFSTCAVTATFLKGNRILGSVMEIVTELEPGSTKTLLLETRDQVKGYDTLNLKTIWCH